VTDFLARQGHFAVIGSTNDVVRGWLADGTPEVCLAVADEQTAGRGREGRTWSAPRAAALLLSLGFRPTWLPVERTWRLAACASVAMAEAAEATSDLPRGAIRLKWPNDLVTHDATGVRKLAGVLGESDGLGGADPRVVIGIGVDGDWPAAAFPPELADSMTSLRALAGDRAIDHGALLAAFIARLEASIEALRNGEFDAATWSERQVTTDREVELAKPDGTTTTALARGVDPLTGALVIDDPAAPRGRRQVVVGEIRHVRVSTPERAAV
jgi:BirA family transcriptional regulator, biotin operon repressor / biotin---[acetyl-CoA-carboxylase] ligase